MINNFNEKIKLFSRSLPLAYRNGQFNEVEQELFALLEIAIDHQQKYMVLGMLANHYHFIKNSVRAESAIQEQIALIPDQVEGWLGLAEHFHYHDEDLNRAAQYIEIALQKGLAAKELVRQILGVRIRIALAQKCYNIVNDSLGELVEYQLPKGGFDVALESDFVSQIPAHTVDEVILKRYKVMAGV